MCYIYDAFKHISTKSIAISHQFQYSGNSVLLSDDGETGSEQITWSVVSMIGRGVLAELWLVMLSLILSHHVQPKSQCLHEPHHLQSL